MDDFSEIFCTNSEEEIALVKTNFSESGIEFIISINNTENSVFGISPIINTRDLSYKYQVQVKEDDIANAEEIIMRMFNLNNAEESEKHSEEPEQVEEKNINDKPNIARSLLLLMIFIHFSRYFVYVNKNIQKKSNRFILNVIGIILFVFIIIGNSILYSQWFGYLIGLLLSILFLSIIEFFINLIDFIITKNMVQGYSWLVLLGLIVGMVFGGNLLMNLR